MQLSERVRTQTDVQAVFLALPVFVSGSPPYARADHTNECSKTLSRTADEPPRRKFWVALLGLQMNVGGPRGGRFASPVPRLSY